MFNSAMKPLRMIAAGAVIVAASLAATPDANAGEFRVKVHTPGITFHFGNGYVHKKYKKRKVVRHYRACSGHQALKRARHLGVRHGHVHFVGKHGYTVKGRLHGKRVLARFDRHCNLKKLRRI